MGKRKITCNNASCKHHISGGGCDTCIVLDGSGKCKSFEKGFAYYFHIVWDALGNKNFTDMTEVQRNPDLRIKALMTMRQKNKTSLEVEEWLKAESGFDMFVTPIRRSIIAEKSTAAMIPLPKFSKRGIVSQDYRCVVHELLKEMEG